jgi:uncharacterized membrane-anchored protein
MSFFKGVLTPAAGANNVTDVSGAFGFINTIVNAIIGILGGGMILLAIYLAYKFMTADDETKRKNAKGQMIYAIMGIVIVVVIMVAWNTILKDTLSNTNEIDRT